MNEKLKSVVEKGKKIGKGLFGKLQKSKIKHIIGVIAVILCVSVLMENGSYYQSSDLSLNAVSNDSYFDSYYDEEYAISNAFASTEADLYYAYSSSDLIGDAIDSVAGAVGIGGGSKSESAMAPESYIEAPQFESAMRDVVVSEDEYLTTTITNITDKKLVYTGNIDVETKDMDNALTYIRGKISEVDGFIEVEDLSNLSLVTFESYERNKRNSHAIISARIPQTHYDEFINSIETEDGSIVVVNISKSVKDMTDTYYDTDSRLRSLRVQEERLFEFMKDATSVSEMLDVEDRLTDVQYEIDRATNTMADIDYDVQYSTVTLEIVEVVEYTRVPENPKNFIERLWGYIEGSADNFLDNLEDLMATIIYATPNLVLWIAIYMVVVYFFKKWRNKRKEKKAKKKEIKIDKDLNE